MFTAMGWEQQKVSLEEVFGMFSSIFRLVSTPGARFLQHCRSLSGKLILFELNQVYGVTLETIIASLWVGCVCR